MNYRKNFWESNFDLLAISCVRRLYDSDNSTDKSKSSDIMWSIYFIYDYSSRYFILPMKDRVKIIERDVVGVEGFFSNLPEEVKDVIDLYQYLQKDSEYRYLDTWQETVEERRIFIEKLRNEVSEMLSSNPERCIKIWESIDKLLLNSKAILSQKDDILERINKQGGIKIKGGIQLSLLAKGIIGNENEKM